MMYIHVFFFLYLPYLEFAELPESESQYSSSDLGNLGLLFLQMIFFYLKFTLFFWDFTYMHVR